MPPAISPQLAYSLLLGPSTLSAMQTYVVRIAGGDVSGVIPYEVSSENGRISFEAQDINNQRAGNYHVINAYNVPMRPEVIGGVANVNLAQITATHVPANPNAQNKMFVTGQLTGCSFVIQPDGNGGLRLAHIQPNPGRAQGNQNMNQDNQPRDPRKALETAGTKLEVSVANGGCFHGVANNNGMIVIGAKSYQHSGNGTVLGVHKADGWHVYFQVYANYNVISATEVYAP